MNPEIPIHLLVHDLDQLNEFRMKAMRFGVKPYEGCFEPWCYGNGDRVKLNLELVSTGSLAAAFGFEDHHDISVISVNRNPNIIPMNYVIEDNVPIPTSRTRSGGGLAATIRSLNEGQSFLCEDKKEPTIRTTAFHIASETGRKFSVRREGNGYRVFCVG